MSLSTAGVGTNIGLNAPIWVYLFNRKMSTLYYSKQSVECIFDRYVIFSVDLTEENFKIEFGFLN